MVPWYTLHPKRKSLLADASADHLGDILQQRTATTALWQLLGFFSKKL
jgi:hypothetical protein